jgi:hypothetical protein
VFGEQPREMPLADPELGRKCADRRIFAVQGTSRGQP